MKFAQNSAECTPIALLSFFLCKYVFWRFISGCYVPMCYFLSVNYFLLLFDILITRSMYSRRSDIAVSFFLIFALLVSVPTNMLICSKITENPCYRGIALVVPG